MGKILVGTCNWIDHEGFYPKGVKPAARISYYAQYFPIVEVDSTFYTLQPQRNFKVWCERTPPGFAFNVKAYRELTKHERTEDGKLAEPSADAFEKFSYSLQPMRECGKLRAILFQFPPWFHDNEENREYIQTCQEFFPDDQLAVEFRHRSWLTEDNRAATFQFLADAGLTYVMVDEPQVGGGSIPLVPAVTNPALAIFRLHGRNVRTWYKKGLPSSGQRFKYLYSRAELGELVPEIEEVARQAREVHVLMNNNYGNYAVINARDVMDLLGQEVSLPPLQPTMDMP